MKNRIREARNAKKMTLQQLGELVGKKKNTLSRYENGQIEPKLETWLKLSGALGVSVGYLQGLSKTKLNLSELRWSGQNLSQLAEALNQVESKQEARLSVIQYVEQLNQDLMQHVLMFTDLVDDEIVNDDFRDSLLLPYDAALGKLQDLEKENSPLDH